MRCLRLVMLLVISIFGLSTTALAEICCPMGFVQCIPSPTSPCSDVCQKIGDPGIFTSAVACPAPPPPPSDNVPPLGGAGGGRGPIGCLGMRDPNQCVNQLAFNATQQHCLNENAADKAEDARTGLACKVRQTKMASQCAARCQKFAALLLGNCDAANAGRVWQQAFGDIDGTQFGFASIDKCGPPLPFRPGRVPR